MVSNDSKATQLVDRLKDLSETELEDIQGEGGSSIVFEPNEPWARFIKFTGFTPAHTALVEKLGSIADECGVLWTYNPTENPHFINRGKGVFTFVVLI